MHVVFLNLDFSTAFGSNKGSRIWIAICNMLFKQIGLINEVYHHYSLTSKTT